MYKHRAAIIIFVLAIVIFAVSLFKINQHYPQNKIADAPKFKPHASPTPTFVVPSPSSSVSPTPTSYELPATLLLPVPFTPQAPTGNWDTIHNEDCEEASAIMANAYYNGPDDVKLNTDYVEGQLTKLTDWEMQTYGYNLDINSEQTAEMIQANYGLHTKILYSYTEDDIKKELSQKHLVLFPANGQMLGNPNFKQPGPKYHMIVLRGYTTGTIITNDPGTRNGLNYSYSFDTLYEANGNWDHDTEKVNLNIKNIIVVWK